MLKVRHVGLYFDAANVKTAQRARGREPFKSAWELLQNHEPLDLLTSTQWNGLRFRFAGDTAAGERGVKNLQSQLATTPDLPYLDTLIQTATWGQCFELLRDHPAYPTGAQAQWLDTFAGQVEALNQPGFALPMLEMIWLALLNVVSGVVLEHEPVCEAGAAVYRQVIDQHIHPQGYMGIVVEGGDRETFLRTLMTVQGMILIAEAAAHVGINLWAYNNRGVSVITAALYPLYYYFYPEKWQWSDELTLEDAQRWFKQHAGFLEILNRRIGRPTKAIDLILNDLRPVYDPYGGGLTTLSHGVRRGLFG